MFLSSEPAKSHPKNHTVMLYEVLDVPETDISILVLPVLKAFNRPEFETVGEVLECLRQVLEVTTRLLWRSAPLTSTVNVFRDCTSCTTVALLIGTLAWSYICLENGG